MITNPILKGFNPDPTIIRIEDDYYIATSTFEWWPGVQIYHSKDLKHWELHSRPLNRLSQLSLKGVPDGGGIWAPCLTYDGKTVYLVYTNVRERGAMMDTNNYLITTDDINGEWSEPIYLNSIGFDPSLFHDTDGRKWLLSLDNHYKPGRRFNGLWIQEYDPVQKKLVGELRPFYTENKGELVEGSHLYHLNGYYYLLKAQGGTGFRHSAQLSRSKTLFGRFEDMPEILLHARDDISLPIQKAGHADLVETQNGEWYMVHLGARDSGTMPLTKEEDFRSVFGRETCIEKVEWTEDGWLKLSQGGNTPHTEVPAPKLSEHPFPEKSRFYDFRHGKIDIDFQSLRNPTDGWMDFTKNGLRLRGQDGLNSRFDQSLLARRVDQVPFTAETELLFEPEREKNMAGLVFIYDTRYWHYLYVSRNNVTGKKELNIMSCDGGVQHPLAEAVVLEEGRSIILQGRIENGRLQFAYSYDKNDGYIPIGEPLDANILTDEHIFLGFTGAMAGICCQDMYQKSKTAEFLWFSC